MTPDKKNSIGRFRIIVISMTVLGLYILGTALYTMLARQEYWTVVSKKFIKNNVGIPATRGNIYDCKGRLLAGSIPEYHLYMDYVASDKNNEKARARTQHWRDSALRADMDSIADGLARIFPDKKKGHKATAKWFRDRLLEGQRRKSHAWRIYPRNATYIQYKACKELPLFRETAYKGGFYCNRVMQRKHPYGSLAARTLGSLRADTNAAKNGLELSYDSILRGKDGISHRMKVRDKRVSIVDMKAEDGHDLVSTIDVDIQDMAEKTLVAKLKEPSVNGECGMAIVMEVATGEVKAIVNMHRGKDGSYYESVNSAVSMLMEPGSTFKTASMMLAMDEGKASLNTTVNCAGGQYLMHGRKMKDHNWHRGGYGILTFSQILEQSSNIGVSRIIDEAYGSNPQAYVDGLKRMGIGMPLNLPFVGKGEPIMPQPNDNQRRRTNSRIRYWSKSDLPWMSIGYVIQQPVISTLTFYNAIANGGKMVKPKFIRAEMCDGEIVREFPTEVLVEQICKPSTLADIQYCLENVVSKGLGRKAGNGGRLFSVSGKTGTAQVAKGRQGYHSGVPRYMVSFCGYFPSEAPKYSCIVCIVKDGLPASGGGQCGPVFSKISQFIMTQNSDRCASEMADSLSVFTPSVKEKRATADGQSLALVPDVNGMGAKDAVFEMKKRGLRVQLRGSGAVKIQSIEAGTEVKQGETVRLVLE
ncbi:MAG: transpeptidase family protein [Bacteroidaceae bacterium]|nr:transpeptidase family protein [Bacteroidaceae bacterium]